MNTPKTIVLMAKAPVAGKVKTRLVPALSGEEAAELYRCFLCDAVERALSVGDAKVVVACTPADAVDELPRVVRRAVRCIPQPEGDLGTKMRGVFERLFEEGSEAVVMTGTDLPTLPARFLTAALALLDTAPAPVVLGPSHDGGYYLLGLRRVVPDIFAGIEWSTERVLQQTCDHLHRQGCLIRCTPPWYDVDNAADLRLLLAHLSVLQASRGGSLPRHTFAWLERTGRLPQPKKEKAYGTLATSF